MIVDAHLHIWRRYSNYPRPAETIISPYSDVPVELLLDYMEEHHVDRAVLVQSVYYGEDNSYVADCARAKPDKYAAVCVVNPSKQDAVEQLNYWIEERGCKGLRLRPINPNEASTFGKANSYPLWERASQLGVVINILAAPRHLSAIHDLAKLFPSVPIIIDHMAHPDISAGVKAETFQSLLELAQFSQVSVKVTGYYYYSQQGYPYTDCWDFFRILYDKFGSEHLIWGSDFPHVLLKTGYRRSLEMQERVYTFLNQDDLDLIMGKNAAKLYW